LYKNSSNILISCWH